MQHLIMLDQKSPHQGSKEHYAILDLPGFGKFLDETTMRSHGRRAGGWYGDMSFDESRLAVSQGDLRGVPASDKFMSEIEALVPATSQWERVDSVVGGFPLIPAVVAGYPLNMRQRRRTTDKTAPLSVFAEVCGSGSFGAEELSKRGAAILALVRALASVRPVELWVIIAFGNRTPNERASVCVRLDTSPLDLARAAHLLTHPSILRILGFNSLEQRLLGGTWDGGWAFGDVEKHRKSARDFYVSILNPGSEALYMPPIYTTDDSIDNPVKWLKDHLREYGGIETS